MSLILLEKQGEAWRSRVEGHFILGAHPIETLRKGLPEAMAQAVIDHCAMAGEDVAVFAARLMAEIKELMPLSALTLGPFTADEKKSEIGRPFKPPVQSWPIAGEAREWPAPPTEPRRARVPRKAAVVSPEAEQAPVEPVAAPTEDI